LPFLPVFDSRQFATNKFTKHFRESIMTVNEKFAEQAPCVMTPQNSAEANARSGTRSMKGKARSSISVTRCLLYGSPHIGTTWLMTSMGVVQGIYAKYYGLSLTAIAAVLLIGRLVDAVSDPVVGLISDKMAQKHGTRKPFMAVGGMLTIVFGYFLYAPPEGVSIYYFGFWYIAFVLAWTAFEIPHIAWGGEIAVSAADKSKVYGFRAMTQYVGLLCFYTVPLLPLFASKAITPQTLHVSALAAGGCLALFLFLSLKFVPDARLRAKGQKKIANEEPQVSLLARAPEALLNLWWVLSKNKPFLVLILAFVFSSLASGMWYGLVFIFVDVYLNMGEYFAQMFMGAFALGALSAPLWSKLANLIGKKQCWALSTVALSGCFIYTPFLVPGETTFVHLLILKVVQTLGYSCMMVVAPALLSEISDYGRWKLKSDNDATYFSLYTFAGKFSIAIAGAAGLAIAGLYGFDVTATTQDAMAVNGLLLAMSWVPLALAVISLLLVMRIPMNARRHAVLRRRLDVLAMRRGLESLE
jgi:glycoside/pentoside/hexuronide:cation symporter, GPH family